MSSTSQSVRNDKHSSPARGTAELRIDAPHFTGVTHDFSLGPMTTRTSTSPPASKPPSATPSATPSADPPAIPQDDRREQLQRHANELGTKLQQRCRDLDQREAQLNTRCAEFEKEVRAARLWISEKQVELREREEQLEAEARALSTVKVADTQTSSEEVEDHDRGEVLDQGELIRRGEELKEVEARLRTARVQLEACRVQIIEKRTEFDEQVAQQRKLFENYQDEVEAELAERRQKLDHQVRANQQIQAVLQRCREEIEQKHRETLQLRLASEELLVRISDGMPTTAMLQSLSKLRTRLADEYRTAEARLVGQGSP